MRIATRRGMIRNPPSSGEQIREIPSLKHGSRLEQMSSIATDSGFRDPQDPRVVHLAPLAPRDRQILALQTTRNFITTTVVLVAK